MGQALSEELDTICPKSLKPPARWESSPILQMRQLQPKITRTPVAAAPPGIAHIPLPLPPRKRSTNAALVLWTWKVPSRWKLPAPHTAPCCSPLPSRGCFTDRTWASLGLQALFSRKQLACQGTHIPRSCPHAVGAGVAGSIPQPPCPKVDWLTSPLGCLGGQNSHSPPWYVASQRPHW